MEENQETSPDKRYLVNLDVFEGPLDLLLHLVRKHELDIFDIPIAFITKKYLEYLDVIKELNLNLASEYLEIAAQLTLIKSKMMLPKDDSDDDEDNLEDGPDPREELVRQLLEYQKYKTAAQELTNRPIHGRDVFLRLYKEPQQQEEREIANPGLFALMEALKKVFQKIDMDETYNHAEISISRISVTVRIYQILDILLLKKRVPFMELFEGQFTRSSVIASFLAILEMTKLGLAQVHQAGPSTEIHISTSADRAQADQLLNEEKLEEEWTK